MKKKRPAGGDVDVTRLLDDRRLNQAEHSLDEITAGAERTFGIRADRE